MNCSFVYFMHQIGWLEAVNINCILSICAFFIATKHLVTVVGLNVTNFAVCSMIVEAGATKRSMKLIWYEPWFTHRLSNIQLKI